MRIPSICVALAALAVAVEARAEELQGLVREYQTAKGRVRGSPKERAEQVTKDLAPILEKIGALDSPESLQFLAREMDQAEASQPDISAACVKPIFASTDPKALELLVKGLPRRSRASAEQILAGLADEKREIGPLAKDLVAASQALKDPEVRLKLPPVLARLGSAEAAKALLSWVSRPRPGKDEKEKEYADRVVAALRKSESPDIRKWLEKDAFSAAGGDEAKLVVVVRLAGELKVAEARPALEKLTGNPSSDVSTEATRALTAIGIEGSADSVAALLEKGRQKGDLTRRIQALDALAASGTEKALDTVLKFAKGKDVEMKAAAMGSLALFKDNPRAREALVAGLQDPDPSIRAVTIRALGTIHDKTVVGPLIGVLGRTGEEESNKVSALKLLVKLTNQNMGLVHEDWLKWWEVVEPSFKLPEPDEKSFTGVKVRDLSYFGIEISSKRLGFVVDISSSMTETVNVYAKSARDQETGQAAGGTTGVAKKEEGKEGDKQDPRGKPTGKARKIDILKKELARVIQKLPADTQINILTFHTTFDAWQKQLQPLAGPGRAKAVQYVQNLQTGTGTNVFDTLEFALKDRRVDTIYLLTDGMPTRGRITDAKGILDEIGAQNRVRGVTIHCIAFGEESKLLEDLAAQNGGQYRFVDSY